MPYIIGIAGGSASGKSTFADVLAEKLSDVRTAVLHMDSYFKPHDNLPRSVSPVSGKTYADYNCPDSFELDRLRNDLSGIAVSGADAVIVEGLLTLWDEEIRGMLDLKIFVDCPADVRIVRRIRRNMTWGLTFDEITEVYLDLVRFRHAEFVEPSREYADTVIDGTADLTSPAEDIADRVRRHLDPAGGNR